MTTLVCLAAASSPLVAQDHAVAVGINGGWSRPGNLTPGFSESVELEGASVLGGQIEAWLGAGRLALRASGAVSSHDVRGQAGHGYDVLTGDVALLLRVLPARDRPWVVPYLLGGAGASMYTANELAGPLGGGQYGEDPVVRPLAIAGAGLDLLPFRWFGLRLEAADRIVFPSIGESPETQGGLPMAHNFEVRAGLQLRFGSPDPVTTVAAAPAAPTKVVPAAPVRSTAREPATREPAAETPAAAPPVAPAAAAPAARTVATSAPASGAGSRQGPERVVVPADALLTLRSTALLDAATAGEWERRLASRGLPVWRSVAMVRGERRYRVSAGVVPSLHEAESLGRALEADFGWATGISVIEADEPIPAGAIRATRAFMRGR
ncbi:MAG TPA: hypothetical protein VK966_12115 [Longimicrobiales bacterium]|nr:hypothetical protein [Longimicrobiales bacterium]